jgi:hypothetical protein
VVKENVDSGLIALRVGDARVAVNHVDERRRFGVLDVFERRDVPVFVEVFVRRFAAVVELAVALDVALRVHRNPVDRARA